MADRFEEFLTDALAPAARQPDRQFVHSVQTRIALEERLASERRVMAADVLTQLTALTAIAGSIIWYSRNAAVADWVAQSPALALAILLVAFGFVLAMVSSRPAPAAFTRH